MTLEESYNLSRDKWFDRIKDESRSQAKKGLCLAVVVLLLSFFHDRNFNISGYFYYNEYF